MYKNNFIKFKDSHYLGVVTFSRVRPFIDCTKTIIFG